MARPDRVYPELKLVIEIYSRRHHWSAEQIQKDHARQNALAASGYMMLIFWWNDLRRRRQAAAKRIAERGPNGPELGVAATVTG